MLSLSSRLIFCAANFRIPAAAGGETRKTFPTVSGVEVKVEALALAFATLACDSFGRKRLRIPFITGLILKPRVGPLRGAHMWLTRGE
jgi:hypothetical protein